MFGATFTSIYSIRSYEQAKKRFESTAPIRGRSDTGKIPLGARSQVDKIYMRKNGESIQCYLYQTPVVTFHPGNTIEVTVGTRYKPSVSDAKFFEALLRLPCYIRKGALHMQVGSRLLTLTTEYHTAMLVNTEGTLVAQDRTIYGYKINRKAANNVRRRYGAFYRWLKATVSLRTETFTLKYRTDNPQIERVVVPAAELAQVIAPEVLRPGELKVFPLLGYMSGKPDKDSTARAKWDQDAAQLIEMISGEDVTNFYRAFLHLMLACGETWQIGDYRGWQGPRAAFSGLSDRAIHCTPVMLARKMDEVLFSYFCDEVFESVPMRDGEVPSKHAAMMVR